MPLHELPGYTPRFPPISRLPVVKPNNPATPTTLPGPQPQDLWYERGCVWYVAQTGRYMPIAFDNLQSVLANYFMATSAQLDGYPQMYRHTPFTSVDFPCFVWPFLGKGYPLVACRTSAVSFAKVFCRQFGSQVFNPGPLYAATQMHQMIVSSPVGNVTVWPKYVTLSNTIFTPANPMNFIDNHLFPPYK